MVVMTTSHIHVAHVCAQVRIQRQDDILYSAHNIIFVHIIADEDEESFL